MSAFRAGLRCRIVRPIYGWESLADHYVGRTVRLAHSTDRRGSIGNTWYFLAEPRLPADRQLADAFNCGYLWVQESAIAPISGRFGAWYREAKAKWPQERV